MLSVTCTLSIFLWSSSMVFRFYISRTMWSIVVLCVFSHVYHNTAFFHYKVVKFHLCLFSCRCLYLWGYRLELLTIITWYMYLSVSLLTPKDEVDDRIVVCFTVFHLTIELFLLLLSSIPKFPVKIHTFFFWKRFYVYIL